jgi:hypothetical protein
MGSTTFRPQSAAVLKLAAEVRLDAHFSLIKALKSQQEQ